MNRVIIDTGFWRAIYDSQDDYHKISVNISERIINSREYRLVVPFPTMYELLRTEFVKRKIALQNIDKIIKDISRVDLIYDEQYRDKAYSEMITTKRNLSFVDCIVRAMLDDATLNIKGLITFNNGDFDDICRKKRIELICY